MKKNYLYILLIVFFIAAAGFVVVKYKNKQHSENNATYKFLPRKGKNNNPEFIQARMNSEKLLVKLNSKPDDIKSLLALANAYITESRVSGNIAYYDKAAMSTVNKVLAKEPSNYEGLLLRSLLQLSQHHFAEALVTATTAVNISPNNAFVHALLVDANVELGNYSAALQSAENMISLRPDLRSYSRIAYLREIHGDIPGAIDAMNLAVQAGIPSEESTEWCRAQLGKLYEYQGDINKATFQYNLSLAARPGYPYALSGLGRIATFEKKYDSAVYFYEQAANFTNDLGLKENLALAYSNANIIEKSKALNKEVINEMLKNSNSLVDDPDVGHYSDKELAYAFLRNNNYDKALEHALAEYNRRPKNIDVNETLAWIYYKKNETEKALPYINAALSTHNMNPELLCTAGLIYLKTGDTEKGKIMLQLGLKNNPVLPEDIRDESSIAIQNFQK